MQKSEANSPEIGVKNAENIFKKNPQIGFLSGD
jgi:hypothetical protein